MLTTVCLITSLCGPITLEFKPYAHKGYEYIIRKPLIENAENGM